MAISKVTFVKQNGGLARQAPGEDHISALLSYNASVPGTGITEASRIKKYTSLPEAEVDGITEASANNVEWYQLKQYFRMNPNGAIYLGIYSGVTYDFDEILAMQTYADGKIRQMGIQVGEHAFDVADITAIQAHTDTLEALYTPLSILYAPSITGTSFDHTNPINLRDGTYDDPNVTVLVGLDGDETGQQITTGATYTVGMVGLSLGVISSAPVNISPAWVGKYQVNDGGGEFDNPMIGITLVKDISAGDLSDLHDYGYQFVRKFANKSGSYISGAPVETDITDDYVDIMTERTVDKAIRGVYAQLVDLLNSPVKIDPSTGYMDLISVNNFEDQAGVPLASMKRADEISGYAVNIDPTQNVLSTGEVIIAVTIVPTATAKAITVNIGLAATV